MAKPCFWGLLTYWGVPMLALHHLLQLTEGGCHFDVVVPVATNHALRSHVVEEGNGGVPEALHVVENHLLAVIADGVGGCNGEYLVEGADAARERHDDVALREQQVLAVAEIVAGNLYVEVGKSLAASLYDGGNYAYGSAAMRFDCLADGVHQADVAAAEY